jgi:hypothetical protein
VFAIFPFDVSVPQLVKTVVLEPGSNRQLCNPSLNWAMDAVGSRVANDPAHVRTRLTDAPELLKDKADVAAIGRNHCVVVLLAAMALSNFRQLFDNTRQLGTNWGNGL